MAGKDGERAAEERGGVPLSRRAVFAGLGLAASFPFAAAVLPTVAWADSIGQTFDLSTTSTGTWISNFERTMSGVPFDMRFLLESKGENPDGSWNVRIKFYKKISKPFSGGGASRVWFNSHVLLYADGSYLTELGPGYKQEVANYGSIRHDSPAANLRVPAGKSVHITSKNRRYGDDITSVGSSYFDFWLYAPVFRTVHLMLLDENGRKRELTSFRVKNGTWIDANNAGFNTAYSIVQNGYGAAVASASTRWYEGGRDGAWNWGNKFWSKEVTGDSWFWMRIERRPVHFMLNDENGNTRELHSISVIAGSRLDTGNGGFSAAYNKIAQIYDGEVAKYSDRWYEGNQRGASNWNKKFGSKTVTGETWIWAKISWFAVLMYSDGTDDDHLVYSSGHIPVGRRFTVPTQTTGKAKKPDCNLNASYGTSNGSGFTGWYQNPELTSPAPENFVITSAKTIKLYSRNRATLRVDYAPDSSRPDPTAEYRTAPRDDAPAYPHAMELPVFSHEPSHRLDGVILPATRDWADQHCCGYYGEVLTLPGFETVYERLGDGRWRTFRAEGWSDPAAGAAEAPEGLTETSSRSPLSLRAAPSSGARVQMRQDTLRVVRWVESVNDGVDTSM